MQFHGRVVRTRVAAGSKSEREAVVLETPGGSYVLRRAGGNPFNDPELNKLVGRNIIGEGEVHQGQLLMTRWNVV